MRKSLALTLIAACALPTFAFASYNDVTLTTDAVISVGGYSLDVSGSSAAVQSITVNANSFSVTLASGSSIQITSPTYQKLAVDVGTFTSSNVCSSSSSVLTLSSAGSSGTVTVTPEANVCSSSTLSFAGAGGSNGPIVGSYGVSSGGAGMTAPTALIPQLAAAPSTTTTIATAAATSSKPYRFLKDLKFGMITPDVKKLQQFLNARGFTVSAKGAGSTGNETTYFGAATRAAVIRFQKAHAITPTQGYVGSITRAKVNAIE